MSHLYRIHSAVCCRCAWIAIWKQRGNHASQYPAWNSWTHCSVVWSWFVSAGDIEVHRSVTEWHLQSPPSCLGDRKSYPKTTWASVEDGHTKMIKRTGRRVSACTVQRYLVAAGITQDVQPGAPDWIMIIGAGTQARELEPSALISCDICWWVQVQPLSLWWSCSLACWWETNGLLHPRNGLKCQPPPSWYGVLSMHQATRSRWCCMARSTSNATLASCA